ncbi:Murein DD-endopeptidase MepM and murein hydrolase activator NlpD, contain LysM domain [Caulobacter sp. UNC279MFTsu5.1]|nr:Murein DD-endopeptidase MepM and murein hydrolase activator NlpD, contain LysM domain [Caulobacter sp. UNC279MFTsu5.1]
MAGGALLAIIAGVGWGVWRRPAAPVRPAAASKAPVPADGFHRTLVIARVQDLAAALTAEGVATDRALRFGLAANAKLEGAPGELRVSLAFPDGKADDIEAIELRRPDGSGLVIRPDKSGRLVAEDLAPDLKVRIKVVRGEMDANSFYSSAVAAGVVDSLVNDFAGAFAFDFDFQREIRPGDIFEAAFEQKVDGRGDVVGPERLVYASLQTQTKSRALYLFQPPGDAKPSWFDGNGASVARGLMRTPVEGARITSSFGPRLHPVLGYTRVHKGTDFAVPVGTTVYASGDGVVDFVGPHGGHGNFVRIRHSPELQTAYAHLSGYAPGVVVGAAVRQGQAIGLSGNTGLSSGPHLHYEVIVRDAQVDPMTFQTSSRRALNGEALAAFRKARDRLDALRAAQNG